MLEVIQTGFDGLWLLEPKVHEDDRGYFFESFNLEHFLLKTKLKIGFVQDNEAKSNKGIIRGLHFQYAPFAQSKLVRVIKGKVKGRCLQKSPYVKRGRGYGVAIIDSDDFELNS